MIAAALLSLSLVTGAFAPQKGGSDPLSPELEMRVQKLGKTLRCATCQGLSITDSPASMARSQLDKVREMVAAGKTDEEIRQYFIARYGEWVLLDPKKEGWNLVLLWAGPVFLLLVGGAVIAQQLRRNARRGEKTAAGATADAAVTAGVPAGVAAGGAAAVPADEYLRAVREELER